MRSRSIAALAALGLGLSLAPEVSAQGRRGGMNRPRPVRPERPTKAPKTPIDEFQTMSPEERQKALNRLPPKQRDEFEKRLQRFNELPPEQQRVLKNMYSRLNQLPAGRQEAVRKSMNQFFETPPDRRQAMREELRGLGALPESEREAHMASPEFRSKFSPAEQEIVRDMSELVAHSGN